MKAAQIPTPPPVPPPPRFALVALVDGRRFGARVREVTLAGHRFVRCVVLTPRAFTIDCAPSQLATVTWCSLEEARAASPPDVTPAELRSVDAPTTPPAPPQDLTPELIELDVTVDEPRVWLAVSRAQARAMGEMPAELASDLGAEDVEVRPDTVAFRVAASDEGRVRAGLDARGVEVVAVCARCGCTEDRRCAGGCVWASAERSLCDRCRDSL